MSARAFRSSSSASGPSGEHTGWAARSCRRSASQARADGYARLSLSVERGNFATTLYRSEGFAVTQRGVGRDTMVKLLR